MNETQFNNPTEFAGECRAEMNQCIRQNPTSAILCAIGAGLAIGLLVRALRPAPTPQDRVLRVLEDLQDRVRDFTAPVLRKAGALAEDGLDAAHDGGVRLDRIVGDATRRVRRFFS